MDLGGLLSDVESGVGNAIGDVGKVASAITETDPSHLKKDVEEAGRGLLKFGKEMEELIKAFEYIMAECIEDFMNAIFHKNDLSSSNQPSVAKDAPASHPAEELSLKK